MMKRRCRFVLVLLSVYFTSIVVVVVDFPVHVRVHLLEKMSDVE